MRQNILILPNESPRTILPGLICYSLSFFFPSLSFFSVFKQFRRRESDLERNIGNGSIVVVVSTVENNNQQKRYNFVS